ncbi:MAG: hypothetical protein JMN25_02555 [gamma proteobacterium endosymbiont of Lamellibrachia anaximandri]|nr:hypothetical protein [gamma proteobacterium endosymbiont of Lamellibrachia anaximandri]
MKNTSVRFLPSVFSSFSFCDPIAFAIVKKEIEFIGILLIGWGERNEKKAWSYGGIAWNWAAWK